MYYVFLIPEPAEQLRQAAQAAGGGGRNKRRMWMWLNASNKQAPQDEQTAHFHDCM
jgi:hypothetical protein